PCQPALGIDQQQRRRVVHAVFAAGAGDADMLDPKACIEPLQLVDPEGRLAGYFMPPFQAERLAADLGPLLAASIQE
ncbi:MAG: hypothetical protein R6W80_17125, partial [Haliea sp.]